MNWHQKIAVIIFVMWLCSFGLGVYLRLSKRRKSGVWKSLALSYYPLSIMCLVGPVKQLMLYWSLSWWMDLLFIGIGLALFCAGTSIISKTD